MRLCALVSCVAMACGGAPKPAAKPTATPDQIPKTAGPSCRDVAAHLSTLADRDPAEDAKLDGGLRGHCESDGWSDDARSCFATAGSDDEVAGCKTKLSPQQQGAFPTQTAKPAAATGQGAGSDPWAAPKEGAKHKTRGYVPKDKGKPKDSDPCEGGE
jgi:hypothetical protein